MKDLTPKTEVGKQFAQSTASLFEGLDGVVESTRSFTELLQAHPDMARKFTGEQLGALRALVEAGDEMRDLAHAYAARINSRLPQLGSALNKLRRVLDRVEGD